MQRYPLLKTAVGSKSKDNTREVVNGILMTYKVLDKKPEIDDAKEDYEETEWTFDLKCLLPKGSRNQSLTGRPNYGLLNVGDYTALVAEVHFSNEGKRHFVLAERFGSHPWQKPCESLHPRWDNPRQRMQLVKRGWPVDTRHPLVKHGLSSSDSTKPPDALSDVARGFTVELIEMPEFVCRHSESQMYRILMGQPGLHDVFGVFPLSPLLQGFSVPQHLEEICAFLLVSPIYFRLFEIFREVYLDMLERFNDWDNRECEKDAIFLATSLLKIVEDGYIHWLFSHGNQRLKFVDRVFVPEEKQKGIGCDIFHLLDIVHESVLSTRDSLEGSWDQLERGSFNMHALCLHWLACRYRKGEVAHKKRRCKNHIFHVLGQEAKIIHDSGRSLLHGEERMPIFDELLSVSDQYSTGSLLDDNLPVKVMGTFSQPTLFEQALSELSPEDLLVFGEVGVLYDIQDFPLHALLSCLTFMHETRGLPFSHLRQLCFISSLARDYIPSCDGENFLTNSYCMPKGLFSGDHPTSNGVRRPVTLWWLHYARDETHGRIQQRSLVSFIFSYPQYARMRVAAYWDPSDKRFIQEHYNKEKAGWEVRMLIEVLRKGFMEGYDFVREAKSELDCHTNALIAAHAGFASGGPLREITPLVVANTRDNKDFLNFLRECPVEASARKQEHIRQILSNYQTMKESFLASSDISILTDKFIPTDDWMAMGNLGLLMREVHCKGYPRGLFSFSVGSRHGFQQWCFLLKWLAGKSVPKRTFEYRPLECHLWHQPPNELSYHLFRHDIRPVDCNIQRRKFYTTGPPDPTPWYVAHGKDCFSVLDHLFTPDDVAHS
jgi:hypothetical protein